MCPSRAAHVAHRHAFLVVVQTEAVEIDALLTFHLRDPQDLALIDRHTLAGNGLQRDVVAAIAICGHENSYAWVRACPRMPCFLLLLSRYQ